MGVPFWGLPIIRIRTFFGGSIWGSRLIYGTNHKREREREADRIHASHHTRSDTNTLRSESVSVVISWAVADNSLHRAHVSFRGGASCLQSQCRSRKFRGKKNSNRTSSNTWAFLVEYTIPPQIPKIELTCSTKDHHGGVAQLVGPCVSNPHQEKTLKNVTTLLKESSA